MKNYEVLPNGVEVVYAFGSVEDKENKNILFLAGTTSWNGELVSESWRRLFIEKVGKEKNIKPNTVFCIPEPQHGRFLERPTRHLIDWETEYLDLANTHVYWLNTYWSYQNAVANTEKVGRKYFSDGNGANIGVTVRFELGASFARQKYTNDGFSVIAGAPEDAQGLTWLEIQSQLTGTPVYWLKDKGKILCEQWYKAVLEKII